MLSSSAVMRTASALLLAALGLSISACGEDDAPASGPVEVTISPEGYEPAELEVEVGDRVTFVNRSKSSPQSAKDTRRGEIDVSPQPGPTNHDGSELARATRKGFATHSLFPGEAQTVVFTVPRTYEYYSAFDPDIKGRITVRPKKAEKQAARPSFKETVTITPSGYHPRKAKVLAGGTIIWINEDGSGAPHTAETAPGRYENLPGGEDQSFDTHTLSYGEPYSVTFHKPGTYEYQSSYDYRQGGWAGVVEVVAKPLP